MIQESCCEWYIVPGIQQTPHEWKTWALLISTESWTWIHTTGHVHTQPSSQAYACHCILLILLRSTRASFCLTRAWKLAWRWRWSGCRETPRRNIAPSGPPHPTPSTQCGTRSPLSLRRCPKYAKNAVHMRTIVFERARNPLCCCWSQYVRWCRHGQILLPEMASLRIVVHEENGKFLGHRIIPVDTILSGQQKKQHKMSCFI